MTPTILDEVKPLVTVYGSGKININTAPEPVLLALGMNASLVNTLVQYRQGNDGKTGTADDNTFATPDEIVSKLNAFQQLSVEDNTQLQNMVAGGIFTVKSSWFTIHLDITPKNRKYVSRYEVVLMPDNTNNSKKWKIIHWTHL